MFAHERFPHQCRSVLRYAGISLLLLASSFRLVSAQTDEGGHPQINLQYNYSIFGADENLLRTEGEGVVEFSFSFPESSVYFGDRDKGVFVIEGEFQSVETGEVTYAIWPTTVPRSEDSATTSTYSISTLERMRLPTGPYTGRLTAYNVGVKEDSVSITFELKVPEFTRSGFSVADIEFLTARRPAEGKRHRFRRGDDILFRNVRSLVSVPDFYLHAYSEVYNLDQLQQGRFHQYWVITDSTGKPVFSIDSVMTPTNDSVMILTQSFRLSTAPTGLYYLLLRVYDGNRIVATDSVSSIRSFYVYNPSLGALAGGMRSDETDEGVIDPIFAGLTEEELDREFKKASYIIPDFKQDVYRGLSGAESKGRFLTNFWRSLDDDPSTPEHPFRDDYYRRLKQASNYYRSSLTPNGWDSDRGRILLTYGTPDGIERHPNDFNRKPFEIWTFASSRLTFVFVDVSQTGNYLLVHSTAPGELRDENWERNHAQMHDDPNESSSVDRLGRTY